MIEERPHAFVGSNEAPVYLQFENDVFIATSEPHGDIEAVITRKDAMPHAKL